MRKIFWLTCLVIAQSYPMNAQAEKTDTLKNIQPDLYFGLGAGLDYGGLGTRFEYMPIKHLGIFGGVGYNFNGIGLNGGLSWKILPDKNFVPVLIAMYGYHTVYTPQKDRNMYGNKVYKPGYTYYGFSPGGGIEFKMGKRNKNKWNVVFFVPIRDEHSAYVAELPFTVSIGFNWGIY